MYICSASKTFNTSVWVLFIDLYYVILCAIYRHDSLQQEVKIALVGKYMRLEDAYISVIKALQHAAFSCRHKLCLIVRF